MALAAQPLTRPPFDAWPDQLVDASLGLRAWFVEPRFVVMQLNGPSFDLAHAQAMVQTVDALIACGRSSAPPVAW